MYVIKLPHKRSHNFETKAQHIGVSNKLFYNVQNIICYNSQNNPFISYNEDQNFIIFHNII